MRLPLLPTAALAAAALVASCAPRDEPGPRYPEGTVLVVSGVPVTTAEVDRIAEGLAPLSPTFTLPHLRRLALTHCTFPLIAARNLGREARPAAREEAKAFHERATAGTQGPIPEPEEGIWKSLGIEVWLQLLELEPGEWSGVFEIPGAFVVARLIERRPAERPASEEFVVDLMRFPYHDSRAEIDQAVFDEELEILDPAWERIVPAEWRLQMTGGE